MAERVPQNGRYFQFLRIALISTFPRSPIYPPSPTFAYVHSHFLSSIALLSQQSLRSPLCNPLPLFPPFSNVLLESDSIFVPAVLLWRGYIS